MRARIVPLELKDGYEDGWPITSMVGQFLDSVREGNTLTTAALTANLDPSQVVTWASMGANLLAGAKGHMVVKRHRPYSDFAVALARAEAEAEAAMIAVVRDVALADVKDSWRAAAWLLDHQQKAAPPIPENNDDDELERLGTPAVSTEDGDTSYE